MRRQEFVKFKEECGRLDADWMNFDIANISYVEAMRQLHRQYGVQTEKEEKAQFVAWEALAEYYDDRPAEEKVYIPEGFQPNVDFNNCLVLSFRQRDFGFALNLLKATFKGNFMEKSKAELEKSKEMKLPFRIVSFIGAKETTNRIMEEIQKHDIHPRVLRNSFFRRDFLHYYNGRMLMMSKRDFREFVKKQSLRNERIEQRIFRDMLE